MSSITVDIAMVEKLRNLDSQAEVRDPEGNVIGFFRPLPHVHSEGEIPNLSEDELKQCFSESGRLTTAEVLKRLRESQ